MKRFYTELKVKRSNKGKNNVLFYDDLIEIVLTI